MRRSDCKRMGLPDGVAGTEGGRDAVSCGGRLAGDGDGAGEGRGAGRGRWRQ